MEPSESKGFLTRLLVLADLFDKKLSPQTQQLYFEALADLPFEAITAALNAAVKACTFMPKPAELRALAVGDDDDRTELAWLELLREVRQVGMYGTPTLSPDVAQVVRRLWGGWRELCTTLPNGGPELLGWAKGFRSAYGAIARPAHLALTAANRPQLVPHDDEDRTL